MRLVSVSTEFESLAGLVTNITRTLIATAILLTLTACTSTSTPIVPAGPREVVFTFESWEPVVPGEIGISSETTDDLPTVRRVSIMVNGFDNQGNPVALEGLDPAFFTIDDSLTYHTLGSTPMFIRTFPGAGVAQIVVTGILLGNQYDSLSCEVDTDGVVVPMSRRVTQITIVGEGGRGATPPLVCSYRI